MIKCTKLSIARMWVFPKAIVLNTKPRFDVKRTYCVNTRLGGGDHSLKELVVNDEKTDRFMDCSAGYPYSWLIL